MSLFRAFGVVIALVFAARGLADEAVWIGPATGDWKTAANWSTGVVPSTNTAARIDDNPNQNTRVESRTTFIGAGMLSVDAGDTFAVINSQFSVMRPMVLDGTISVEGTNPGFGATVVVNPGAEIRLAPTSAAGSAITAALPGLFNEGTIHGGGILSSGSNYPTTTSWNESTIRADNPTIPLTIQTPAQANLENDGILSASGGGKLQIVRGNLSYDFGVRGGRIEAYPGSTVLFGSTSGYAPAYVEDSVLAAMDDTDPSTAAPSFQFVSGSEFKNVTLQGKIGMGGASIIGTLTNQTELLPSTTTITSGGTWHNTLEGDVLLKGGGTISLGLDTFAMFGAQSSVNTSYRLTNVDNLIHGSGELAVSWYGFTNRGVVQADAGQNKELYFYNGQSTSQLVNSGVMKAINGGRLRLGYSSGATAQMKNFEGTDTGEIVAGENASVLMNTIQIQGGVLRAEGTDPATRGKFIAEPGVVLQDVTLDGKFRLQTLSGVLSTVGLLGTIHNPGSLTSLFSVSTTAELTGGGEIIGEGGQIFSLGMSSTLINDDNVIHGKGTVFSGFNNATIINRGTFRADGGGTLSFALNTQFSPIVNSGLLEAAATGNLTLPILSTVLNYEGSVGGTIHAADGGTVSVGSVVGGTLATDGTGLIKLYGTITDVHNTGTIQANNSFAQGTIVNDGVITGTMSLNSSFVRLDGSGRWEGAQGSLSSGTFENGLHHTILGVGAIGSQSSPYNAFLNEGTIETSDAATQSFQIYTGSFENTGLVHVPAGKSLAINSTFSRASNYGKLRADGNMSVTSPNGLYNESGGVIDVRATLTLTQTLLHNRVGGTITGNGQIAGPITTAPLVVNEGVIDPGPGVGTLTIGDDFQQLATGQLKIDVAGGATPLNDLLQINGAAALAGSLAISLSGTDPLAAGNTFTILAATGGVTGTFGQVTLPTLDPSLFWYLDYEPNSVRALVANVIPGDFNRNGSVGSEDYVWWRSHGGTEQQYGDWVANFGVTFNPGSAIASAQVPEPASCLMTACGLIVFTPRRSRSSR